MAVIPFTLTSWGFAGADFWSGSSGGTYVGCVESFGARFRARDAQGSWLGDFPTLGIASAVIGRMRPRLPL